MAHSPPRTCALLFALLAAAAFLSVRELRAANDCSIPGFAFGDRRALAASCGEKECLVHEVDPVSFPFPSRVDESVLMSAMYPPRHLCGFVAARLPDAADLPINPESQFLDRGRRNPWMAALASLVIPGAGQFYNSAAPHAFTLQGYDWWMYGQGGLHALGLGVAIFHQLKGLRVQYIGGGVIELNERDGQIWRMVHVFNALVASVTAWLEADLINRCGWNYIVRMRMHAWYDPVQREACVCASFTF